VQRHKEEHQLSDEDVISLINKSGKREGAHAEFYADIARMVGQRPVVAVYHHVKRMYAADARKGKWSTAEDAALQTAYAEIGAKWELVSAQVGRAANDCRDRYRNILSKSADREQTLGWTSIEEYELDQAVRSLAAETGVDIISGPQPDLAWGAVSKRLKGKRTRLTCANRWADVTYRLLIGRGELAPWLQYDTYMLISRCAVICMRKVI
jgi:Myb-like DNA-binding protein REB1